MSSSSAANKSRQETEKSNKDSKRAKVEGKVKENKANFRTVPLLVVIFAHSIENRIWLLVSVVNLSALATGVATNQACNLICRQEKEDCPAL